MSKRIVDACCLINLFASGEEVGIVRACGMCCISDEVRREAIRIRQVNPDDPADLVSRDIDPQAATGVFHECRLESHDEMDAFVRFATRLDDGEASCLAIAQVRGWIVATDDRKARRVAQENGIALVSTPELILEWVRATSADESTVGAVLRNIERFAKFRPSRTDPLSGWWNRCGGSRGRP